MIKNRAIETLKIEAAAVENLIPRVDEEFVAAVQEILHCNGRVVVTGMGKSGHIGRKIAATLASTGTPAFFLHPAEAYPKRITAIWEWLQKMILSLQFQTAAKVPKL